jgi:hypothetical protein
MLVASHTFDVYKTCLHIVSVFVNWQLVTGLPGTIVWKASAYAELDGKHRDNNLYVAGIASLRPV